MTKELKQSMRMVSHQINNINKERNFTKSQTKILELKRTIRDFPGGAVDRTLHSQCRGPGFDPWSEN